MLCDVFFHLFIRPAVHNDRIQTVVMDIRLDQLVRPVTGMAVLAVDQRIREAPHVTGSNPCLRVHENGCVQSHIILGLLDHLLPPGLLHVVLEQNSQRAVVPGVGQSAVDLGSREDESSVLRK